MKTNLKALMKKCSLDLTQLEEALPTGDTPAGGGLKRLMDQEMPEETRS